MRKRSNGTGEAKALEKQHQYSHLQPVGTNVQPRQFLLMRELAQTLSVFLRNEFLVLKLILPYLPLSPLPTAASPLTLYW